MISYESLGLYTKADREALDETLVTSHDLRIDVFVLTLEGDRVGVLSDRLIEGQVNIDNTADVTRSANLTLYDPNSTITFDSDSPAESAMYLNSMIQIRYCVKSELLADWVRIPIFTGPIVSLSRDDDSVVVECQGKELLAMGSCWTVFNRPKGAYIVDVIRDILKTRTGESKFNFPDGIKSRLDKPFSISKEGTPWLSAKKLAQSINRQLYYDGAGVAQLRPTALNSPQWTFETGNDGSVLTTPSLAFSTDDIKNVVVVNGGAPKGASKKVSVTAMPVDAHPLSPKNLGRNGVGRYLVETINNAQIRSAARATEIADNRLSTLLRQEVNVTFEASPIPMLEEHDAVSLKTDDFTVDFNADTFTIPLISGSTMNMGFLDRNRTGANKFRNRTTWTKTKTKKKSSSKSKKTSSNKNKK